MAPGPKPTHRHVLRDTRHALGITRNQLAEMVRVAPVTIAKIENGCSRPSRALAQRIQAATGLNAGEVMEGDRGRLPDGLGSAAHGLAMALYAAFSARGQIHSP